MPTRTALVGFLLLLMSNLVARAQAPEPPPKGDYVTREEYEKLKAELEDTRKEMAAMKRQEGPTTEEVDDTIDQIQKDLKSQGSLLDSLRPGGTKLLLTGYGFVGYNDRRSEHSSFDAGFNPIFLWQLSDRLLFEGELEFGFDGEETTTSLEYANLSYIINDYMMVGAGKFLLPFAVFNERLHPAWINKLPDRPLPFQDGGLAPEFDIGAYVRGAVPIKSTRLTYDAYVVNGPTLNTDSPDDAGKLGFEQNNDVNDNKAVGGRIAWLPVPELEFGYSIQFGQVSPDHFEKTNALLQAVDASYVREFPQIAGRIDLRLEWVWSSVERATYDRTGAAGFGPVSFDNDRNGGYLQAAYRPTQATNKILRNTEFIVRYDQIDVPNKAPGSFDEERWTLGVDYWVTPSVVVKMAYEFDTRHGVEDDDAFLLQLGYGF